MSDNVKLFVGNLPLDATQEELNKLFAPYGEINTCSLLRQYAFVTLKGEGAADRYTPIYYTYKSSINGSVFFMSYRSV